MSSGSNSSNASMCGFGLAAKPSPNRLPEGEGPRTLQISRNLQRVISVIVLACLLKHLPITSASED